MLGSIVIDVVDVEEESLALSTADTLPAVGVEDRLP